MNKIMTVNFRGDELYGFELGGIVYVAVKPIIEAMGLDWASQLQRLKRDPVLAEGMVVTTIPFGRGGPQKTVCLKLSLINGWLFRINSNRVHSSIRERVIAYQRECYDVLYSYFSADREKLLQQAHESESLRLREVSEARHIFGQKAAAELWRALNLPVTPAMSDAFDQYELFGHQKRDAA